MLNLLFLGPPGAGKGTVAQAVSEKYGLVQLSTGDLVRAEIKSGSELGKELAEVINAGNLVEDKQISKMFEQKMKSLLEHENFNGVILDGFPRTIPQTAMLEEILKKLNQKLTAVIYIKTDDENLIRRLSSRYTCSKCKKVYNSITLPSKVEGICDLDGAPLIQRDDDKPEVIKKRLVEYRDKTAPLIEHYEKKRLLKSYDGNVPPKESIELAEKLIDEILE
jgi:adenylate kinase